VASGQWREVSRIERICPRCLLSTFHSPLFTRVSPNQVDSEAWFWKRLYGKVVPFGMESPFVRYHFGMEQTVLSIAQVVPWTEAEGPGLRFAIWFQGCPLRCPGCCNPEFLPFSGGESISIADLLTQIDAARAESGIEGVSLLGGEPFAHAAGGSILARAVRERGLSVMVYSGYTLEQIREKADAAELDLLAQTDLLVDGPYVREMPETERRWIGSQNQRVHFLTDRYSANDPCWKTRNTLEIRVRGREVTVNGFPAAEAVGLWRKPKRMNPTPE
jgi:anaerobic ribonucleoside-triphosphate reductase activating protein